MLLGFVKTNLAFRKRRLSSYSSFVLCFLFGFAKTARLQQHTQDSQDPDQVRPELLQYHSICLSLKQVNRNPVLMENNLRKAPHCSPAGCLRGAGMYRGLQYDQKSPTPLCRHVHTEKNLTLFITTSIKKITPFKQERFLEPAMRQNRQAVHWTPLPFIFVILSAKGVRLTVQCSLRVRQKLPVLV